VCAFHVVETEPQIIKNYIATGKVKLVYRHLLQLGDGSLRTGEASECAADQGKFWPMRAMLYARQNSVYGGTDLDATLAGFAKDLGLDTTTFSNCMQTHKHQQFVQDDYRAAVAAGVQFRPAFDINGAKLTGAQPFTAFQKQIDAALRR
jgi:protein-disulfide isomerase